jgi:bifunctional DNA-binding transcriptional regulator/antitoxin component of YhaV-PrlF toxin-antitoxin module/translation initiation factor IF-1
MRTYRHHIISNDSVNVVFDDGVVSVRKDNLMFKDLVAALNTFDYNEATKLVDIAGRIKATSDKRINVNNGIIYIKGDALPDALSKIILSFLDNKLNVEPLYRFWQNLKKNPSQESRNDLYGFLAANKIPITADGCFVAYKMVDENYKDSYTHTICNKVGKVVKMKRDKVNADRNQTCSNGLHVAAFAYANTFGSGHLMEIKINPKDVVSVPTDYNQQKMRVCEYKVVRECEIKKEREETLYTDDDSYDAEDEANNWSNEFDSTEEDIDNITPSDDVSIVNVKTDKSGRLGIPSVLIKALGLKPGDNAYVEVVDGELRIFSNGGTGADAIYKVDKNCNVRLSPITLKLVTDHKGKDYVAEIIPDEDKFDFILIS